MRSRVGFLVTVVAWLLVVSPAAAGTYSMNFDALSAGAVVSGGPGGMTMPQNPTAFNAGGHAYSSPNGLRRAGNCPNSGSLCTTGDHRLELRFSAANPASRVSMRVGTVVPTSCFEFDCPTIQLVGYDASNHVVALTARSYQSAQDLVVPFAIDAHAFTIRKAVLVFSGDPLTGAHPSSDGSQWTAQLDNLSYTVDEGDPPPPPPPAAPTISIDSPASGGPVFADTDVTVSGHLDAPAGLSGFCVEANAPTGAIPDDCNRTSAVRVQPGSDTFSLSRIPGMRPGINFVRAFVRDGLGRAGSDSVGVFVADGSVDYISNSIELNQGVQVDELPSAAGTLTLPGVGTVRGDAYDGVPLSDQETTVARVYAAAQGAGGPVVGATAELRGYMRGSDGTLRELPGSPLRPHFSPTLARDPSLAELRADPRGTFNFVLPSSWTEGGRELVLIAETAPSASASGAGECCPLNNRFALEGIRFVSVRTMTTYTVELPFTPPAGGSVQRLSRPADQLFDLQRAMWPGPIRTVNSLAPVDVSDVLADGLTGFDADFAFIDKIAAAYGDLRPAGKILGLNPTGTVCAGWGSTPIGATGCADRVPILLAHESSHTYGLAHAMRNGACDGNALIGARADRQPLNGVGLDTRFWSGGAVGLFAPLGEEKAGVFDATPDASTDLYDYMSYCALGSSGWVSANYWATTVRQLAADGRITTGYGGDCCFLGAAPDPTVTPRRRGGAQISATGADARAAAGHVLDFGFIYRAYAPFDHELTTVENGTGRPSVPAVDHPDGSIRAVVLDRDGKQISSTPIPLQLEGGVSLDGKPVRPAAVVHASVPSSAAAARLEIRGAGNALLAARNASAHSPTVKLKKPKRGTLIKAHGRFEAKWKRADADGGELTSRLQLSRDGGRNWQTIAGPIGGSRARLAGDLLPRMGRKGRLRVVVSDGFNTAVAQVKPIKAQGTVPVSRITAPSGKSLAVLGDTNLALQGHAYDDRGSPIAGKRLTWSSAGHRLGRGAALDVPVYKLGRTLKLTATDYAGRKGSDKLKLKVRKVAPIFTTLEAAKLGARSRKLKLRIAASMPAKLRITGKGVKRRRAKVGPKRSTVKVRTKGKLRGSYDLKLKLSASGERSKVSLSVPRG